MEVDVNALIVNDDDNLALYTLDISERVGEKEETWDDVITAANDEDNKFVEVETDLTAEEETEVTVKETGLEVEEETVLTAEDKNGTLEIDFTEPTEIIDETRTVDIFGPSDEDAELLNMAELIGEKCKLVVLDILGLDDEKETEKCGCEAFELKTAEFDEGYILCDLVLVETETKEIEMVEENNEDDRETRLLEENDFIPNVETLETIKEVEMYFEKTD